MTTSQQLRRNRDFVLFTTGRLLSAGDTSLTSIAYPLLVLELTHSPSKAGLVSFARLLPTALAVDQARSAGVSVAGPSVGGALFTIGHAVPFVVDAASYVASTSFLLAMRRRFQEARERETAWVRARLAEGFRHIQIPTSATRHSLRRRQRHDPRPPPQPRRRRAR